MLDSCPFIGKYYNIGRPCASHAAARYRPATAITGALSGSQPVAALVGIPVGRWLDRRGSRGVMTAGSLLAVLAVVAGSLSTGHMANGILAQPVVTPIVACHRDGTGVWPVVGPLSIDNRLG
jgi:MFS family permease